MMSSIFPPSDRMEDVTKESDDVKAQEVQEVGAITTEEAGGQLDPPMDASADLATITTTLSRDNPGPGAVDNQTDAATSTDQAGPPVVSRSGEDSATANPTEALSIQSEQSIQPLQTQPISTSRPDIQPAMNSFESADVTAVSEAPAEDFAVPSALPDVNNTQNIQVTPEMQSMFASVSLLHANGEAPGVTDMEMEVLQALIAAGSGVDENQANGMEGIESTADMLVEDSSTGLVPPPRPSTSVDTPTTSLPLTATALASVPTSSVPIPTPATPRASDPPIPIDHALTEPIAAFYKLQFYAGNGEGDEEEGFAYYMQTLDVMIGRKVILQPPVTTSKSPIAKSEHLEPTAAHAETSAASASVPFDSVISLQEDKAKDVQGGSDGRMAAPVQEKKKEERQVDVDLGALKSVSRLHARIGYSYTLSQFYLEVLGRNGAWIDDVFVVKGSRVALGPRTKIQISTRTFYFVLPPASIPTYPIPYNSNQSTYNMYANPSPAPSPPDVQQQLLQANLLPLDGHQKPAAFNAFSNREEWEYERMSLFGIGAGLGKDGAYGYKRKRRRRHRHRRAEGDENAAMSSSGSSGSGRNHGLGSSVCSSCGGSEYWSSASASDEAESQSNTSSSLSEEEDEASSSSLTSQDDDDDEAEEEEEDDAEADSDDSDEEDEYDDGPLARTPSRSTKKKRSQSPPPSVVPSSGKGKGKDAQRKVIKLKVKLPFRRTDSQGEGQSSPKDDVDMDESIASGSPVGQVAGKRPGGKGVKAVKKIFGDGYREDSPVKEEPNDPSRPSGSSAVEKAAAAKAAKDEKLAAKKAVAEQKKLEKQAAREAARIEKQRLKDEAQAARMAKKIKLEAAAAAAAAPPPRPPPVVPAKVPPIMAKIEPGSSSSQPPKLIPGQASSVTSAVPVRPAVPPATAQKPPTPAAPVAASASPAPPRAGVAPSLAGQIVQHGAALSTSATSSPSANAAASSSSPAKATTQEQYAGLPPQLAAALAALPPNDPVPTTSTKTLQAALQSGKSAPMEVDPIPLMSGNIPVSVPIPPTGQPRPPPGPILGVDGKPFIGPEPIKPQLTYATIIHRALSNVARGRGTLGQVCDWVAGEWEWFRLNPEAGWQNSIRHNLSLNKAFLKVPRIESDDPESKGSVWILDPIHAPEFEAKERKAQELKDAKMKRETDRFVKDKVDPKNRKPYKKETATTAKPPTKAEPAKPIQAGFGLNLNIPPIPRDQNFPIKVAPIPPNLRDSVVNPNPALLDGPPLVVHDSTIILNPSIFSHLTTEHLQHLQSLGTQQTLQILQAYIVQYLKEKMRAQAAAKAVIRPPGVPQAVRPIPRPPLAPGQIATAPGQGLVRPGVPTGPRPPVPGGVPAPNAAAIQAQARPSVVAAAEGTATAPAGGRIVTPPLATPSPLLVQAAVRPPAKAAAPKAPTKGPGRPPSAQAKGNAVRPSLPMQTQGTRPMLNGKPGQPVAPTVRPMRPQALGAAGQGAVRPRPAGALPGGKPPLPAETLRILAQLAAATGASASNSAGGPSIAPGAAALLQYLQRVGTNADMSVATKILATGIIPPHALPAGAGAGPATAAAPRPRMGALPTRPTPPRPAVVQPKVGIGGGTPIATTPKPASSSGGLTPLPSGFSGDLSPLPGRPSPSILGKRPLDGASPPVNGDAKKQKVA